MQTVTKISEKEYFSQELKAASKSEYHGGEVVAMAGASEAHNLIVSNLLFLIKRCLWEKNCKVYPSDMLLKLKECDKYVYPDVMIVCENSELEKRHGVEVLLNPVVIIEVLSDSTRQYDQTEKMRCYLELDSLQEYIMVDSEQILFESYTKNADKWDFQILKNIEGVVKIYDCEMALKDVYRNVL